MVDLFTYARLQERFRLADHRVYRRFRANDDGAVPPSGGWPADEDTDKSDNELPWKP